LQIRANRRAANSDFNGTLADLKALDLLAHHHARTPTLNERNCAITSGVTVAATLYMYTSYLKFTPDQYKTLVAAVDEPLPLTILAEPVDVFSRWYVLDILQWIATGKVEVLQAALGPSPTFRALVAVDRDQVDWDSIFKNVNAFFDDETTAIKSGKSAQITLALDRFRARIDAAQANVQRDGATLSKKPTESREQYTARVADRILLLFKDQYFLDKAGYTNSAELSDWAAVYYAASRFRAQSGRFATQWSDLVPAYLPEIPTDISPDFVRTLFSPPSYGRRPTR
jgi:hypothetical protein